MEFDPGTTDADRLVVADRYIEAGDVARGIFIRLQIESEARPTWCPKRLRLETAADFLRIQHSKDWEAPLRLSTRPGSLRYRRGFIEEAYLDVDWPGPIEDLDPLAKKVPLRRLSCYLGHIYATSLDRLTWVRALYAWGHIEPEGPIPEVFSQIRELKIDTVPPELLLSHPLEHLERLSVNSAFLPEGAKFTNKQVWNRLTSLSIRNPSPPAVDALPVCPEIRELNLGGDFSIKRTRSLVEAALHLRDVRLQTDGNDLKTVLEGPTKTRLQSLDVPGVCFALDAMPRTSMLRHLEVGDHPLDLSTLPHTLESLVVAGETKGTASELTSLRRLSLDREASASTVRFEKMEALEMLSPGGPLSVEVARRLPSSLRSLTLTRPSRDVLLQLRRLEKLETLTVYGGTPDLSLVPATVRRLHLWCSVTAADLKRMPGVSQLKELWLWGGDVSVEETLEMVPLLESLCALHVDVPEPTDLAALHSAFNRPVMVEGPAYVFGP